jgi:MFS family permease
MYKKRLVFWSACLGILLFGMAITTLGSVVPALKAKFALDEISSGTLFSILPFGILVGSLLFGPFCDRYGFRVLLALSCLAMFIGFEGIAYAPTHGILKICIFLFGMGGGAINGATSALVSDISEKDKGANLSLLGFFFGLGALGMPFILGILENKVTYEVTISLVGFATLLTGLLYLLIRFPPAKHSDGLPLKQGLALLKDPVLLLISFFLFFQSAFESIINNWTTTFLTEGLAVRADHALFGLSLFVAGMAVMRLILGSVLRNTAAKNIWILSFSLTLGGLLFLTLGHSYGPAVTGLILLGAGLAAGFPIMLGYVGNRYQNLSGTAFSLAFTIALAGNMIINYATGFIVQHYGIRNVMTVAFVEAGLMIVLCTLILRNIKTSDKI